jgi:hypothetical protein
VDWSKLALDRVKRWAFMNTLINLRVPYNEEFLDWLSNYKLLKEDNHHQDCTADSSVPDRVRPWALNSCQGFRTRTTESDRWVAYLRKVRGQDASLVVKSATLNSLQQLEQVLCSVLKQNIATLQLRLALAGGLNLAPVT